MSSIYIISDIHGCKQELMQLYAKITFHNNGNTGRKIICVGDYIDRGPDSKGVIDFVMAAQKEDKLFEWIALMGNHEDMMLHDKYCWSTNGAFECLASYDAENPSYEKIPQEHKDWVYNLPLYHVENAVAIAHAGIPAQVNVENADPQYLLWSRELRMAPHGTYKYTVHGHTPMKNAIVDVDVAYIDTACVFGGKLCALFIPDTKDPNSEQMELLFHRD